MLLPREFFARSAVDVAPALLGCVIEHETPAGLVAVMLTETEAYTGGTDPASHAYRGMTARNAVMFGPPGHAYVYFTYGMHFCVNLVCEREGTASAVLLRAGRVITGTGLAADRRAARRTAGNGGARGGGERDLARGPARLCQALAITRTMDGADVCDPASPLRVRPGGRHLADRPGLAGEPGVAGEPGLEGEPGPAAGREAAGRWVVSQGPRVGVSAASDRPWRFWLDGDPTVSVYRPHTPRARRGQRALPG